MDCLGVRRPLDQLRGDTLGACLTTHSIHPTHRSRSFARLVYYDPTTDRANLHVLPEHQVIKLVVTQGDGNVKVTGVEVRSRKSYPNSAESQVTVSSLLHRRTLRNKSSASTEKPYCRPVLCILLTSSGSQALLAYHFSTNLGSRR